MSKFDLNSYRDTCPECSTKNKPVLFHFEVRYNFRLFVRINGVKKYKAKCPGCDEVYLIQAPKDNQ